MVHSCIQKDCKHEEVKFCSHCGKVYCVKCGREWEDKCTLNRYTYYYPYYPQTTWTYPQTTPSYKWDVTCGAVSNTPANDIHCGHMVN